MSDSFKLKTLVSALTVAGLLTACGGGGGGTTTAVDTNTNAAATNTTSASVSGAVADGYLVGAKVCLDKNANGACDAGEPSATTTAGGKYEIKGITVAESRQYAVVAEVPATAVDEDTGTAVGGTGYVLAAPAGKPEFVSPLSTLVHKEVKEGGGLSVAEAEAKVKNTLGLRDDNASLLKDYVQEKKSNETYGHLHKVAQVLATVIKEERSTIQQLASAAGVTEEQATNVILDKVMTRLAPVLEAVKAGASVQGTVSTAGLTKENLTGSVTKEDIKSETERKVLISSAVTANPLEAWKDAMYSLDAWTEMPPGATTPQLALYVGQLISKDGTTLSEKSFRRVGDGEWLPDNKHQQVVLTSTGWKVVNDGVDNMKIVPDGDHLDVTNPDSGARFTVKVAAIDLAGKPLRELMERFARNNVTKSLAVRLGGTWKFSEGAKGQVLQIIRETDEYNLWTGGEQNGAIWFKGGQVTSLDGIVTDAKGFSPENAIGYGNDGLSVTLGADGKAYFGRVNWQAQTPEQRIAKNLGEGVWEKKTVAGQELIVIPLTGERRQDSDHHAQVFALYDGKVRGGSFRPKGGVEQEINFNWTAMKDLEAAVKAIFSYFSLPTF